jgi:hypothetical protein
MQRITKQVIASIVTAFLLFVAVLGSYLPMRKAEMFISALQSIQTQPVSSLGDLEGRVSPALDAPSPIGQEELVRNLANSVLGFAQNNQNQSSTEELLVFLHSYYDPILARNKGMSFGQDLYLMGAIHEIAFVKTGDSVYLNLSRQYYAEGNELGPNRPQTLYGLFDVYRFENDLPDAVAVAQKILSNWSTDQNVAAALAGLEAPPPAPTSTKASRSK